MMRRFREDRRRDSIGELFSPQVQKELGITAEQRQKLEDIRFNMEKEAIQHRSALQIHRLELSHLINAENPDRAAIDKKIQEVSQEEGSLMRSSIDGRLNARGVLTAEQRTKLAQLRQNRWRAGRRQAEGGARPGQPASKTGPSRERAPLPVAPAKPSTD
jgi:Spy/CpxP family protein refolding chaperone